MALLGEFRLRSLTPAAPGCFAGMMAAPNVLDGQQCFLAFAAVFERLVLPRLDVQSLLLLAATCRDLTSWLTNLPPVFWQVSTRRHHVCCWLQHRFSCSG